VYEWAVGSGQWEVGSKDAASPRQVLILGDGRVAPGANGKAGYWSGAHKKAAPDMLPARPENWPAVAAFV